MLRGTTVPTLMLKLIELRDTFGALLDCRTVVRTWVFCSGVSDTAAPVCELVVDAPACELGVVVLWAEGLAAGAAFSSAADFAAGAALSLALDFAAGAAF